ncbi:MAG: DMT family transporter [Burkholderiaceae bacterium]
MSSSPYFAAFALLINATVWGLSWRPFKALEQGGIHPLWTTFFIFSLAALVMLIHSGRYLRVWLGQPLPWILLLAAGLTNVCFNTAVALGDVVRVVLLFYVMPLWSALLARIILQERITLAAALKILLGLAGAMLVVQQGGERLPLPQSLPDWLALAGGFCFALNNVLLKKMQALPGAVCATAMLCGAALVSGLAAAGLSAGGLIRIPGAVSADQVWLLLSWSGLFLLGNMCLQFGASRLPPGATAMIMLSEVLIGTLSAWFMGVSLIRPQDWLGGALILAASAVSLWRPHKSGKAPIRLT